jgi:hypothetical protein
MKTLTVKEIRQELSYISQKEMIEICLRLSRFKKENKELLTYLLVEKQDEETFIEGVKQQMDEQFETINTKTFYYIKKSVRKILASTKKYIRYSQNKETEAELLLYFCHKLKKFKPSVLRSSPMKSMYIRQMDSIKKIVSGLHEDLQYDFQIEIDELELKN